MSDLPDANEWTEWVCPPVLAADLVAVKFRDGRTGIGHPSDFEWTNDGDDWVGDIVAFKIIEARHE